MYKTMFLTMLHLNAFIAAFINRIDYLNELWWYRPIYGRREPSFLTELNYKRVFTLVVLGRPPVMLLHIINLPGPRWSVALRAVRF